jgi:hypothetical protein
LTRFVSGSVAAARVSVIVIVPVCQGRNIDTETDATGAPPPKSRGRVAPTATPPRFFG